MIDDNTLFNLKEQVEEIEENYIGKGELIDYLSKKEASNSYLTIEKSNEFFDTLLESVDNKLGTIDLSIYITSENLSERVESLLSDINTSIDSKFDEINSNIDLSNIVKRDELNIYVSKENMFNTLSEYVTDNKLSHVLTNYVTHDELNLDDVLAEYVTKNKLIDYISGLNIVDLIDKKFNKEFESVKEFYDGKVSDLISAYVDTLNKQGYLRKHDIDKLVVDYLEGYMSKEDIDRLVENKGFIDNDQLQEYVVNYVKSKLNNSDFLKESDLENYVLKSDVPTKVSQLENDKNYLTKHQSLEGYVKMSDLIKKYVTFDYFDEVIESLKPEESGENNYLTSDDLKDYVTKSNVPTKVSQLVNDKNYLTKHQSLEGYVMKKDLVGYVTLDELDKKINDVMSSEDDMIQDVDLSEYAKKTEIPSKTSELTNDSGFLTKHQSLENYVKRFELNEYVKQSDFDKISNILNSDVKFATLDDIKGVAHVSDIPHKTSELLNDSGFLTKHQSLENYVKKPEMVKYVTFDDLKKSLSILQPDVDLSGYVTKNDLKPFVKIDDIPHKTSELLNDSGFLTKHQSLENYVKKQTLDDYVTSEHLETIKKEIDGITKQMGNFLKDDSLKGYATMSDVETLISISKPKLSKYVKKSDLGDYVKFKNLPDFNDFVTYDKLELSIPDLSGYLTEDDLREYVKKIDVPNVYDILNDELKKYVKGSDFKTYKDQIEKKGYQTKNDIDDILTSYVKKSDLNGGEEGVDDSTIKEMIENALKDVHVPTKLSELSNDVGYLTKYPDLSGYVKKHDIIDFITVDDGDVRYMTRSDFKLPDTLVYKQDIKQFVTNDDLDVRIGGLVNKSQLDKYMLLSEYENNMKKLDKKVDETYSRKDDLNDVVKDITINIENIKKSFEDLNINGYVSEKDFNDFVDHMPLEYAKRSVTDEVRSLNTSLEQYKTWVDKTYVRKGDIDSGSSSNNDVNYDGILNNYYTKGEVMSRFLLKEDYRGIKRAATVNFEYNDYPDLFFDVLNNYDNIKVNDGFYVVEEKAYIVRNNQIVPICDRRTPHWEIETTDEPWCVEDIVCECNPDSDEECTCGSECECEHNLDDNTNENGE